MVPEKPKHMGATTEVRTTIVRATDMVIACVSSIMKNGGLWNAMQSFSTVG